MADIAITVEGAELPTPISYQCEVDLLTPADSLQFTLPLDAETLAKVPLDGEVQLYIDGAPVFNGFIETTGLTPANEIRVEALCRVGRLVAESVPGAGFGVLGKRMATVIRDVIGDVFDRIEFSNARDRRLRAGRGKRGRAGSEPAITVGDALATVQHIEAGTPRWTALERIFAALQLLAWSSGDGRALIVARPQYDQEPTFDVYETRDESNVKEFDLTRSNANRYSEIEVSGSGFPPGISPPPRVQVVPGVAPPRFVSRNKIGRVLDGPNPDGTGGDFLRRKRLFVVSEALNQQEAAIEALRYAARAKATARQITLTLADHGQVREGTQYRTLYTPDTIATCLKTIDAAPGRTDESVLVRAPFYVTSARYSGSRTEEQTILRLVPVGTLLV